MMYVWPSNSHVSLPSASSWPTPKPSTPALLLMHVRFLTRESRSAAIRISGMPHRPKPPHGDQLAVLDETGQRLRSLLKLYPSPEIQKKISALPARELLTVLAAPRYFQ